MSKALTTFMKKANLPTVEAGDMAAALQDTANDAAKGSGGAFTFLQFSGKSGKYTLGRNKAEVDPEALYIIDPSTFLEGWICWMKSKPVDRIEWSIYKRHESAIPEEELDDHGPYREKFGEGWHRLLGFCCIEADELKEQVKFTNNSISGVNAISDLMMEVSKRVAAGEPAMPIIRFDAEEFEAQETTNFKPVFDVEVWADEEGVGAYLAEDVNYDLQDLLDGSKPPKKRATRSRKK